MTGTLEGKLEAVRGVADAVMREGKVLYPYRASATKNHLRFQFGVIAPKQYVEMDPCDPCCVHGECIWEEKEVGELLVQLRFMTLEHRDIQKRIGAAPDEYVSVPEIEVDGDSYVSWDESLEHAFVFSLFPGTGSELREIIRVPGKFAVSELKDSQGMGVGRVVRKSEEVQLQLTIREEQVAGPWPLRKLVVELANETSWRRGLVHRDELMRHSILGTHFLAVIEGGKFYSMVDHPEFVAHAVSCCSNKGLWPILASGDDAVVLFSPIILPDHPMVAPESEAEFFDATEIDELLALRIMTLTDEEKREVAATDSQVAEIVQLCDAMPEELLGRLHGAIRSLVPAPRREPEPEENTQVPWWDPGADKDVDPFTDCVEIDGVEVSAGSKVILRPSVGNADSQDMFIDGQVATIAAVLRDVDGNIHLAVTIDNDPGSDLNIASGRFLYFSVDEVKVVGSGRGEA